ncbi:trichohyalin-like [Haliotis rufescens]|uniref:trichohyalin-like n=1 Tax=Haliotis rufescens TaxID=6454 RepID=UPI001EB06FCE|nr:trichohyalin-like [Haliotis rufescens]
MMLPRILLVPLLVLVAAVVVTADVYQVEKHGFEAPLVFFNFATEKTPLTEEPSEEECDWELDTEVCVQKLLEIEGDKKIKGAWESLRARRQNHTSLWKDNLDLWKTMMSKDRQRMGVLKETKDKEREKLERRLKEKLLKMEEEEKKEEEDQERKLEELPGLSEDEIRRKLEEIKRKIREEWQKKIDELELTMKEMLDQI